MWLSKKALTEILGRGEVKIAKWQADELSERLLNAEDQYDAKI